VGEQASDITIALASSGGVCILEPPMLTVVGILEFDATYRVLPISTHLKATRNGASIIALAPRSRTILDAQPTNTVYTSTSNSAFNTPARHGMKTRESGELILKISVLVASGLKSAISWSRLPAF
jgi:hypothetical protein